MSIGCFCQFFLTAKQKPKGIKPALGTAGQHQKLPFPEVQQVKKSAQGGRGQYSCGLYSALYKIKYNIFTKIIVRYTIGYKNN